MALVFMKLDEFNGWQFLETGDLFEDLWNSEAPTVEVLMKLGFSELKTVARRGGLNVSKLNNKQRVCDVIIRGWQNVLTGQVAEEEFAEQDPFSTLTKVQLVALAQSHGVVRLLDGKKLSTRSNNDDIINAIKAKGIHSPGSSSSHQAPDTSSENILHPRATVVELTSTQLLDMTDNQLEQFIIASLPPADVEQARLALDTVREAMTSQDEAPVEEEPVEDEQADEDDNDDDNEGDEQADEEQAEEETQTNDEEVDVEQFEIFIKGVDGVNMTVKVHEETTVEMVKANLASRVRAPIEQIRLIHGGKQLKDHKTMAHYGISNQSTAHLTFCLRGGGRLNIKKLQMKKKGNFSVSDSEKQVFSDAFDAAKKATSFSAVSFKDMLKTMDLEQLEQMREYIVHDKTGNEKKFLKLGEWAKEFKQMEPALNKLEFLCDKMKELVFESIAEQYGDRKGNLKKDDMMKDIDITIGVVKERSNSGSRMNTD